MSAPANIRANVNMKAEIVLADKEVEAKIMAVVNAEPGKTKGAAMCSQMAAANLERIRMDDEDGGCDSFGPPFTQATGLGWDVSTEPKNREDMIALAKSQNPVVGFWGECSLPYHMSAQHHSKGGTTFPDPFSAFSRHM